MHFKKNKLVKPFFIAEAGSNFNQNLEIGKKLIFKAKKSGADAVKFQLFKAKLLYPKDKKMFKIFKEIELSQKMFKSFKKYADKIKIDISASAFDMNSLKFLEKCNVKFHKIASSELTNFKLLKFLAKTNKPIFLSTGMSDTQDIKNALNILKQKNSKIVILQCGSMYPLPYKKNNLNVIQEYKKFGFSVGLSDHTLDDISAITSVGLGAKVFEKHFTLSKKMSGPDHFYAMEPYELKSYINKVKKAFLCLGSNKKKLLPEERKFSRREGLYFKKNLSKNHIIIKSDLIKKRPPLGIRSRDIDLVINKKININAKKGQPVFLKFLKK